MCCSVIEYLFFAFTKRERKSCWDASAWQPSAIWVLSSFLASAINECDNFNSQSTTGFLQRQ